MFVVFQTDGRSSNHPNVPGEYSKLFFETFERIWNNYKSCKTAIYVYGGDKHLNRSRQSKAEVLLHLHTRFAEILNQSPYYVEQKMTQEIMDDRDADFYSQLDLLERVDISKTLLDMDALFVSYTFRPFIADECLDFAESIQIVFPNHKSIFCRKSFVKKLLSV